MTVDRVRLRPGDVLIVRTATKNAGGLGAWLIRRRALMLAYPWMPWRWWADTGAYVNHIAIYTHTDGERHLRGLEGRPGGFGWANLDKYLADPVTVANTDQPKTDVQRGFVVSRAVEMIGIPYDWEAILAFAAGAAGLPFRLSEWPETGVPSHVVCSSAADYLYEGAGLDNPGGYAKTRGTDPQDWWAFEQAKPWLHGKGTA